MFVGTYFNYFDDTKRKNNTLEFCDRYPWVLLLQGSYKDSDILNVKNTIVYKTGKIGFIDYHLINRWLKDSGYIGPLIIIDTDLILQYNFRELMLDKLKSYDFVSGWRECFDLQNGEIVGRSLNMYLKGSGHCGYIYGFSSNLLKKIGKFDENFLIGGFDWILANKILGIECGFKSMDVYKGISYCVLDCVIINNVHRNGLLTNFDLYKNLDSIKILSFMKRRICP